MCRAGRGGEGCKRRSGTGGGGRDGDSGKQLEGHRRGTRGHGGRNPEGSRGMGHTREGRDGAEGRGEVCGEGGCEGGQEDEAGGQVPVAGRGTSRQGDK